ncbi:Beta-galactosidase 3 [Raphanus sativus]|nr:Beta-galactosidase 3 [Raphanus sativus]
MNLAYPTNTPSIGWMDASLTVQKSQPLTWHKTYFDAPEGDEPLALDMENMGKLHRYIQTEQVPIRLWPAYTEILPRAEIMVKAEPKPVVVFEELGGNPSAVSLVKRSVSGVCAEVSEYHPNIKNWQLESYGKGQTFHRPKVHLKCSPGQAISAIKFASFGTPLGKCGSYQQGECHAAASYAILERKCVGKARCAVTISNSNFGKDPCPNVLKRLTVEAVCSHETSVTSWRP